MRKNFLLLLTIALIVSFIGSCSENGADVTIPLYHYSVESKSYLETGFKMSVSNVENKKNLRALVRSIKDNKYEDFSKLVHNPNEKYFKNLKMVMEASENRILVKADNGNDFINVVEVKNPQGDKNILIVYSDKQADKYYLKPNSGSSNVVGTFFSQWRGKEYKAASDVLFTEPPQAVSFKFSLNASTTFSFSGNYNVDESLLVEKYKKYINEGKITPLLMIYGKSLNVFYYSINDKELLKSIGNQNSSIGVAFLTKVEGEISEYAPNTYLSGREFYLNESLLSQIRNQSLIKQ